MSKLNKARWILAAAVAAGAAGLSVTPVAIAKDRPAAVDSETQVKYASLPKAVKETLDKERGEREVKSIFRVERDGRVFYRATIDFKGDDRQFRIAEDGGMLSENVVKERPQAAESEVQVKHASLPKPVRLALDKERGEREVKSIYRVERDGRVFYRATVDFKGADRQFRFSESGELLSEAVTADTSTPHNTGIVPPRATPAAARGVPVKFEELPGKPKAAIARLIGGSKIKTLNRDGEIYHVEFGTPERTWGAEVDMAGKVLREYEDTPDSKVLGSFDHLPGKVKAAVAREAGAAKIGKVIQISRDKDTYYRIEILDAGNPRWISINDDGKVVDYPVKK